MQGKGMKFELIRFCLKRNFTLGFLSVEGNPIVFTLEDADRLAFGFPKIKKRTAIPVGIYRLRLSMSARFKIVTPEIVGVAEFTGIRIHPGNTVEDTEGCPLPGFQADIAAGTISQSRDAFKRVVQFLETVGDESTIEVRYTEKIFALDPNLRARFAEDAAAEEKEA